MGSKSPNEPKLVRHIRAEFPSLEALFAAGDDVLSLMDHPGWSHVGRVLSAEVAEIDRSLDGMSPTQPLSHEAMCFSHGRRGGLRDAHATAQAILAEAERRREEQRDKHERDAEPSHVGG